MPPAAHYLTLHVGVGIVLAGIVVAILVDRPVRGEPLQPLRVILVQTSLVVVDEHRSGDVHGIDQNQPFSHAAFLQAFLYLRCEVQKGNARRRVELQFFAIALHGNYSVLSSILAAPYRRASSSRTGLACTVPGPCGLQSKADTFAMICRTAKRREMGRPFFGTS